MPKAAWLIFPLTLWCWWYGLQLHKASVEPLFGSPVEWEPIASTETLRKMEESAPLDVTRNNQASLRVGREDGGIVIDDSLDRIFYFVQVSDVHISQYKPRNLEHLRRFLNTTVPMINPEFVLVTGDLTDAKDGFKVSQQLGHEWSSYHEALKEAGVFERPGFWWDQRGNHDAFNVPSWESAENYFRQLSVVKDENYAFQVKKDYGTYSFIGLDGCPVHGPSRPFNFFSYFDRRDMDYLEAKLKGLAPSNHTFLLSHYPYSMTITGTASSGMDFDHLSGAISVFMCGHLHKLVAGVGDLMHVHHPSNFLELELGDLKAHGSYRVVSVDHDIISFVDSSLMPRSEEAPNNLSYDSPAPVVLITNPKDARYVISEREPIHRIKSSTHIRVLIFSHGNAIEYVSAFIDGQEVIDKPRYIGDDRTPLWTIPWDPLSLNDGQKHKLTVIARDSSGVEGGHSIVVDVSGKRADMQFGTGRLIITPRYEYWTKVLFMTAYLGIMIFLLLIPKVISLYLHRTRRYHRWRIRYSSFLLDLDRPRVVELPHNWILRFLKKQFLRAQLVLLDFKYFFHASLFRHVTLASLPSTYFPLLFHALYIVVGPYFVGELISKSKLPHHAFFEGLGYFYLYGIWVEDHWVPLPDTWLFAFFELLYVLGPLVVYLSFCITPPEQLYSSKKMIPQNLKENQILFPTPHDRRYFPLHRRLWVRLCVAAVSFYQLVKVYFIGLYYGPVAFFVSPGLTWFVLWGCYALYKHRWSSEGHEIELLEDEQDRAGPRPFFALFSK